jgi:hypothetical protein
MNIPRKVEAVLMASGERQQQRVMPATAVHVRVADTPHVL